MAKEPQLAVRGKTVYVAYGAGDRLYVQRSDDAGARFAPPVSLPTAGHLALGMRRGPRVACAGPTLVVTAVYGRQGGGKDGELTSWRSTDGGKTWKGPTPVSDVPGAAREGLHAMAATADGTLACAWLDLRAKGTAVWVAVSTDGGASWSPNRPAYRSPSGSVCECCHPSLAFGPRGRLYLMFRNALDGARDMYLTASDDLGATFAPAQKLGRGTWPLNACPMDGGAVAVTPEGRVETVWRRNHKVYACAPGQPERELGDGTQPWLALVEGRPLTVWLDDAGSIRTAGPRPAPALPKGVDPVVAAVGGQALAAWADGDGGIRVQPF